MEKFSSFFQDADKKEMKNVLKTSLVNVAECNSSTTSVLVTFAELR